MEYSNFYARLGIPKNAGQDEIRKAFRDIARRLHPDVNTQAGATEIFINVQEAFDVLSNAKKRSEYDKLLNVPKESIPAITINTLYSQKAIQSIQEPQLLYTLLDLMPIQADNTSDAPPINLCLAIDRSTSMQGVRMDTVKSTAIQLIKRLKPQDSFALVSFSDRAEVVIPASKFIDVIKVEALIRKLQTGGGTEIFRGLEAGYGELRKNISPTYTNQLILITDGRTYGDEESCFELAEQVANQGIAISALGIGSQWNDHFLDRLSAITGGETTFAADPKKFKQFLLKLFQGIVDVFAEQICLNLNLPPGVELRYAIRLSPSINIIDLAPPLRLGSIPNNQHLSILLEFLVPPIIEHQPLFTIAQGMLDMTIPSQSIPVSRMQLDFSRPVTQEKPNDSPPKSILEAMSHLTLYRMQEQACQELAVGNVSKATQHLQHLARQLISKGESNLAKTVLIEANRLQNGQTLSQEGEKQIKYGTRALLLPPESF